MTTHDDKAREQFKAWFKSEYPLHTDAGRHKYQRALVQDLMFAAYRAARAALSPASTGQATLATGDHDFPVALVERVRNACSSMGIATSESLEECSLKLDTMLYNLCHAIDRWHAGHAAPAQQAEEAEKASVNAKPAEIVAKMPDGSTAGNVYEAFERGRLAALEEAAKIVERFCACDDRDVQDDINMMLRNRASRIRSLKSAAGSKDGEKEPG